MGIFDRRGRRTVPAFFKREQQSTEIVFTAAGATLFKIDPGEVQKRYAPGRVTFIIDKAGIIRFIQKGVPDNKVLLKELEKLGK